MPHNPNTGEDTSLCVPCGGDCYFLGCSVLGFNGTIGWGGQESSVTVDLIEYICPPSETQEFIGENLIGYPVYFACGSFFFGGLLQNWTYTENSGGKTYNVRVIDPRQILEQCVLIIDTYAGPPIRSTNYFDVYGYFEESVYLNKNCSAFGTADVTERGMPYTKIMEALRAMNSTVCTPVGANLFIDWSTFNIPVPEYFKIAGPSITILQLISDICDEAGYEFFVTLDPGNIIRIHTVSMKQYNPIEDNLLFGFQNVIDFSYGRELRMAKTRNLIFGEQQHYLDVIYTKGGINRTDAAKTQYTFNTSTGETIPRENTTSDNGNFGNCEFYFGEHPITKQPITPYKRQYGQFWVNIDIRKLNLTLVTPLPVDYVDICEYDLRTAMGSAEAFWGWTENIDTVSELGKLIQFTYGTDYTANNILTKLDESAVNAINGINDMAAVANTDRAVSHIINWPPIAEDKQKIHEWINELGRTYYGKQYLVTLKEKVCIRPHPEEYGEKMYTDTPTNDGGWVDPGKPVLGLGDPELDMFKTDDGRVGALALFVGSGNFDGSGSYIGDGGGEVDYTIGSGVAIPISGGSECFAPDGVTPCNPDSQHPDYISGCSCQ